MLRMIATLVLFSALGAWPRDGHAETKVVATVPALAAIAKEIAGEQVSVKSLTRPTQDAHFVDARPSLALDLNKADLLLVVGLDLEVGWLPTLITGARNQKILPGGHGYLDCSQFVALKDVRNRPVDRSQGDIHPGGNPHYLSDPRAAAEVGKGIAARLAEVDPPRHAVFETNLAAFLRRLTAARLGWEKRLSRLAGAPLIGYHRTWVYLAEWLGLVEVGFLEPKPGIPPSPAHVAQLLALARQRKVRAILQEDYYPETTSRLVAVRIPVPLLRMPGGPDFQRGESYIAYVGAIADLLDHGLAAKGGG